MWFGQQLFTLPDNVVQLTFETFLKYTTGKTGSFTSRVVTDNLLCIKRSCVVLQYIRRLKPHSCCNYVIASDILNRLRNFMLCNLSHRRFLPEYITPDLMMRTLSTLVPTQTPPHNVDQIKSDMLLILPRLNLISGLYLLHLRREVSHVVSVLITLFVLSGAVEYWNIFGDSTPIPSGLMLLLRTYNPTPAFSALKIEIIRSILQSSC